MIIIAASLFAVIVIIFAVGKIRLQTKYSVQLKELLNLSPVASPDKYSLAMLENLPAPVQRYFKSVLKEGQSYINSIKLTHNGVFKTGLKKKWAGIDGEQHFTTVIPGFLWKGTTSSFTARDMLIGGKGRLIVNLFSIFKVVDASGKSYDQGELLRWLSESVWFPTNLLPSANLRWEPIDMFHAKLLYEYNGINLKLEVTFNDQNEIVRMETKRFMNEKKLETWIVKMSNYNWKNNVLVPSTAEAAWRIDGMEFPYAKFRVKQITYNLT